MKTAEEAETDRLVQVLRYHPVFEALRREPLERRELEDRLGVSRATSHRYVRSLAEIGLIEKAGDAYRLTRLGEDVAAAVAAYDRAVRPRLRLAPLARAASGVSPPLDVEAFLDATVTSADHGDPYAPLTRFVSLVQETGSLRGINTCRIAPTYMEEFQGRILAGMETELIDLPGIIEDIMEHYPEKCVEVCVSGNLTPLVHPADGALPFGLVLFDDRVGVGLFDGTTGTLRTFVDTADRAARAWASELYAAYRGESAPLENFTKTGLREALEMAGVATS